MAHKIQFRRDTAANWTATDPVLAQGELGIEIDLPNKIKIGDGTSLWSELPYYEGAVGAASDVTYDNTTSGLTADDVQAAIDEIVEGLGDAAALDVGTTSGTVAAGDDARLSDTRDPNAHAASHASGADDAIKLDDLAAPDDNTDLNASTDKHGLLPKLGGGTTNYLRADGTWAEPAGGGGADLDTIRRSMFFQDGVTEIRDGQYAYDLIVSILATDVASGGSKYVTTESPNRVKNVYFDTIQWKPTYGTYGELSFKMYFETYYGGVYDIGVAQTVARASPDDTTITYSHTDSRAKLYWTIVFDISAMDTSVYTCSLENSQIHPSVVQGGGRLVEAKAADKHRIADAYPAGAHSLALTGGPIRWIKLVIEDDSANLWHHANGELRRVIMKYGRNNAGTLTLSPRLEDSAGSNTYSYSWIAMTGTTSDYIVTYTTDSATYGKFTITAAYDGTVNWDTTEGAQVQLSPALIQAAYNDYLACRRCSPWRPIYGVTRTDSNTFAKTGLETTFPVGSHVRSYSGTTRPATTSTDWKHHYVSAVGTNAVDVIGEEIPTGGTTLFVEYSTMPAITMEQIDVQVPGYWAYATGTSRLASQSFTARPCIWNGRTARLIGAMSIKSVSADSGATQPTLQITAGGTDLLGSALSVSATATDTGVVASGQALSPAELIDIDCESTGTNADSKDLIATFLIARHI